MRFRNKYRDGTIIIVVQIIATMVGLVPAGGGVRSNPSNPLATGMFDILDELTKVIATEMKKSAQRNTNTTCIPLWLKTTLYHESLEDRRQLSVWSLVVSSAKVWAGQWLFVCRQYSLVSNELNITYHFQHLCCTEKHLAQTQDDCEWNVSIIPCRVPVM